MAVECCSGGVWRRRSKEGVVGDDGDGVNNCVDEGIINIDGGKQRRGNDNQLRDVAM